MHEQRGHTVEVDNTGVGYQRHAGQIGVAAGKEKVAVAVHEENRYAGAGQLMEMACRFCVQRGSEIVIAHPGFEQVPQNVECVGMARHILQKFVELPGDGGPRFA